MPKPRFRALLLAEELADHLCAVELRGDGASNLAAAWTGAGWPSEVELDELSVAATPEPDDLGLHTGLVTLDLRLPMPGVARVRCRPGTAPRAPIGRPGL